MHWLVPVLPDCRSASAFIGRWCVYHLSPHDDLLEGGAVYHICFAPPWCIPLFLRLLTLFSALNVLGGKTACSVLMSSGQWLDVSTIGCLC